MEEQALYNHVKQQNINKLPSILDLLKSGARISFKGKGYIKYGQSNIIEWHYNDAMEICDATEQDLLLLMLDMGI